MWSMWKNGASSSTIAESGPDYLDKKEADCWGANDAVAGLVSHVLRINGP